ncbi:hypothetical protein [Bdellovibrio svalbardensis]|uniref:Uncharacterized protein n=1 Tax=Bdellovibrio svalbardensis TaxID=2972972 RepID=A0ABT6DIK8_9BACT|nr:hypothetical protein [Bdellovibrio svalbardensis]MDG0816686.1 hypothetical protein [Bdellovibrio svalbardensis]
MSLKSAFAALLIFSTTHALAYPSVGDKVTWSGEVQRVDGTSYSIQITKEVIEHDKKDNKWKVKVDAIMGAEKTSDIFESNELYSPSQYKNLLAGCTSKGGTIEDLKLSIGTYKTCKLTTTSEDGTLVEKWWGDIPFGVISKTTKDSGQVAKQNPALKSILVGL